LLVEQQIAERQERAKAAPLKVLKRPASGPFGDYTVKSASGQTYRVAVRGPGLFENYCSCPDFAVNTLGTCKHIEAMLLQLRKRHQKKLETAEYKRTRASISLQYGDTIEVRLRMPASTKPALRAIEKKYFDDAGLLRHEHFGRFSEVLDALQKADGHAVIYSDVLDYIDRENELTKGLEEERRLLAKLKRGQDPVAGVLKTKLLPYQVRGALFAACRGRVVLADDMGLGKTIQALAGAELLCRAKGIQRVLVIAPASVKYQWKTEIEKFTNNSVQVIDGLLTRRRELYTSPSFFNLINYELVLKDLKYLQELNPDLIILDEAQRIRNWTTTTARTIKQLKSRYAFVLTGTPLENKLEELFSVVEFVDGRRLGPAFRFVQEHRIVDEKGKLLGYRGLDRIKAQLGPILLRRTRQEVLKELPERTDQIFRVPLTEEQAEPYREQSDILASLMHKWERQGWISEMDQKRILCCIQNMRMLCNSTFLFDKQTHHSPKLDEFREILREIVIEENRKVVVFSEYERMTFLAGEELRKLGIGFVSLHGGVPSAKRGALIEKFKGDPDCNVFLSTDAGGVGLNLQAASVVVNFEPPWNPARLEQRIGRVHRLGQSRPVHVINMLTSESIEERVWETLQLKKSLFAGVFDSPTGEVSFAKLGRKTMMQAVKEIFNSQPSEAKPVMDPLSPTANATLQGPPTTQETSVAPPNAKAHQSDDPVGTEPKPDGVANAAASLLEAGLRFIETIASDRAAGSSTDTSTSRLDQSLSGLFSRDAKTNRPVLSIPLPESVTQERLTGAIAALLSAFK